MWWSHREQQPYGRSPVETHSAIATAKTESPVWWSANARGIAAKVLRSPAPRHGRAAVAWSPTPQRGTSAIAGVSRCPEGNAESRGRSERCTNSQFRQSVRCCRGSPSPGDLSTKSPGFSSVVQPRREQSGRRRTARTTCAYEAPPLGWGVLSASPDLPTKVAGSREVRPYDHNRDHRLEARIRSAGCLAVCPSNFIAHDPGRRSLW